MTKTEFQSAHGPDWAQMVRHPAFFAAMQLCGSERLHEIENLSAAEIEAHGKIHLANFQGHLKTESILLGLAVESQGADFDLPPADYGAPTELEPPPVTRPVFQAVRKATKPRKPIKGTK